MSQGRTLAIGDIHGCHVALDTLLRAVAPTARDRIVTLGDYVDRGPDSRAVLECLIELHAKGRLVSVLGNHDQMMLDARSGDPNKTWWLDEEEYGPRTLDSYAPPGRKGTLDDVPTEHWRFLEKACREWFETDTHFFVHANAYPDHPLDEQPAYMLRWEFFGEPRPHENGKVMVCGHTAQKSGRPRNVGHAVCIDTWVYGNAGWLTCLDVASGRIWQANQKGETREGKLAAPDQ